MQKKNKGQENPTDKLTWGPGGLLKTEFLKLGPDRAGTQAQTVLI